MEMFAGYWAPKITATSLQAESVVNGRHAEASLDAGGETGAHRLWRCLAVGPAGWVTQPAAQGRQTPLGQELCSRSESVSDRRALSSNPSHSEAESFHSN